MTAAVNWHSSYLNHFQHEMHEVAGFLISRGQFTAEYLDALQSGIAHGYSKGRADQRGDG